ncbi:unnamed protein product [Orchesella dallaii]|uniref:Metalloendopeptidase n=1 Tax=Orchesella dallaii TaxID=48710 RepID=A0ABP1QS32_9HEXA
MLVNILLTIFSIGLMLLTTRVATQVPKQHQTFDVIPGNLIYYNGGVQNSNQNLIPTNTPVESQFQVRLSSPYLSPANQNRKKLYQKGKLNQSRKEQSDEKRGRQGSNCRGVCNYIPDRDYCPTTLASATEPDYYDDDYDEYDDYYEDNSVRRHQPRSSEEEDRNGTNSGSSFHVVFPSITRFAVTKGSEQNRDAFKKFEGKRNRVKARHGRKLRRPSSAVRLRPPALEQEIIIRWDRVVERGPFMGGDIVVPDGVLLRPPNLKYTTQWPNGEIPYTMDQTINNCRLKTIYAAMDEIEDLTCIRFVEREKERNYLSIRRAQFGCASYVGMIGGRQHLNLSTGCFSKFTVTHELIHAIGFDHEQSRRDRNNFIEIDFDNVKRGKRSQFVVNPTHSGSGFPYDIRSIMHYSAFLFAKDNCEPTIYPVNDRLDVCDLGTGNGKGGMTKCDAAKINRLYKCGRKYSKRCKV